VNLEVSDDALEWLAVKGYDKDMGARPMQRLIQEKIKKELAEDILFGRLSRNGGSVRVSVVDDELVLEIDEPITA
jgi:ATP-dependent Clp protease ATP-binding subunit ClpA